jgi:hypothetical protein
MPSLSKYVRWSRLHPRLVTVMGQKLVTSVFAKWRWNSLKLATKPFWERDEVTLKQISVYRLDLYSCGLNARKSAMIEVAAVVMGLVSAGIFVAHAVDAYRAQ